VVVICDDDEKEVGRERPYEEEEGYMDVVIGMDMEGYESEDEGMRERRSSQRR
jgi:hypothetical protein